MNWRMAAALGVLLMTMAAGAVQAAGTLDRINQDKSIRIAYRDDAPPFSYKGRNGEPAGFMVDLCRAVAAQLGDQLHLTPLKIVYVPVTAANRFDAITQGKADLLCEPTTETLTRRQQVDFSIPTFVDGAGLLIRSDGPKEPECAGRRKNRRPCRHHDTARAERVAEGRRHHSPSHSRAKPMRRVWRCSMTARSRRISPIAAS